MTVNRPNFFSESIPSKVEVLSCRFIPFQAAPFKDNQSMIVLGLDTSAGASSVALIDEHGLLGEYFINTGPPHSQRLIFMLDELLKRAGLDLKEIAGLAVAVGPGTFTGLRVGLSTAKGLALGLNISLLSVPTLDALAQAAPYSQHLLCPILDARKKQLYSALYRWEAEGWTKLTPDLLLTPAELAAKIDQPVIFLGDAVSEYGEFLQHTLGKQARFAPAHLCFPRAHQVAQLGLRELKAGRTVSAQELVPRYVRRDPLL